MFGLRVYAAASDLFHVEIVYAAALAANLFHVEVVYGLGHSCEPFRRNCAATAAKLFAWVFVKIMYRSRLLLPWIILRSHHLVTFIIGFH